MPITCRIHRGQRRDDLSSREWLYQELIVSGISDKSSNRFARAANNISSDFGKLM